MDTTSPDLDQHQQSVLTLRKVHEGLMVGNRTRLGWEIIKITGNILANDYIVEIVKKIDLQH